MQKIIRSWQPLPPDDLADANLFARGPEASNLFDPIAAPRASTANDKAIRSSGLRH
ncbi:MULTISPECIES: hypothetical protein [unclassified Sinorhizobium]|uniref:hypothetical protein n=1 Tax=unclassified Sinorhizobium TaxID=2613772 RepID=UPI003523C7B0